MRRRREQWSPVCVQRPAERPLADRVTMRAVPCAPTAPQKNTSVRARTFRLVAIGAFDDEEVEQNYWRYHQQR
jgi:hypothetical protein